MTKTVLTLCMIYNDTDVLLGKKKRGFGTGYFNGFGGHVEEGETIEDAAYREVREEILVEPRNLQKRGVLNFFFKHMPEELEVHVFSTSEFEGEPKETEEMEPRWYPLNKIPYQTMWADDKYWLPILLAGKNFRGEFYFKDAVTLLRHKIREI
ncbi:MAG: 8-oxo-dGTP diphosphatase [bacterium]|nr:8-oxo-dGTP diphosphatase [bacterium]